MLKDDNAKLSKNSKKLEKEKTPILDHEGSIAHKNTFDEYNHSVFKDFERFFLE